jgi:UDPglucose 6-dehydrogenase
VCTDWNEFKQLDLVQVKSLMAQPIIADGRNMYEPEIMRELGFQYRAVGRGATFGNGR